MYDLTVAMILKEIHYGGYKYVQKIIDDDKIKINKPLCVVT